MVVPPFILIVVLATSTRVTAGLAMTILPTLSSTVSGKLTLQFRVDTAPWGVSTR